MQRALYQLRCLHDIYDRPLFEKIVSEAELFLRLLGRATTSNIQQLRTLLDVRNEMLNDALSATFVLTPAVDLRPAVDRLAAVTRRAIKKVSRRMGREGEALTALPVAFDDMRMKESSFHMFV
jgi:hypothetical protein